jgi:hypothetical protein
MRLGILSIAAFVITLPLFSLDLPLGKIADDSALRIRVAASWLNESPARALAQRPLVYTLEGGGRVQIRAEAGQDEFMIILARELLTGGAASGYFPGWAQGSWILTRRKDNGEAARIRVFLRSDPYTYVQFRPFSGGKCQMDVVVYDAYLVQSLPLPIPFERLYTMPVTEVLSLAGTKFPRRYFEPQKDDYQEQRRFIEEIRERLPELQFADDGAIDQAGQYVYIETLQPQEPPSGAGLNCSGFAKWLIDGILRPVTGQRLAIAPLKAPYGSRGSSFTDLWEEERDPFFGLDWIRNLASTVRTTLRSADYGGLEEIEIRAEPFSQVIVRDKSGSSIRSWPGFLENSGYGIEGLHPLLYTLAIDDPGAFYLAAVNTEMGPPATADNPRGRPRMRQYFHVAALVPYFNEYGVFQIAVFESAAETSFTVFKNRYPGHQVNLVRVLLESRFEP